MQLVLHTWISYHKLHLDANLKCCQLVQIASYVCYSITECATEIFVNFCNFMTDALGIVHTCM